MDRNFNRPDRDPDWPPRPPSWLAGFMATPQHPDGAGDHDAGHAPTHEDDHHYARWREEHARALDAEYRAWRQQRFHSEFDAWRRSRDPRARPDATGDGELAAQDRAAAPRGAETHAPDADTRRASPESAHDAQPGEDPRVQAQMLFERS